LSLSRVLVVDALRQLSIPERRKLHIVIAVAILSAVCVLLVVLVQEELYGCHHDFSDRTETGGRYDIHRPLISPDALPIELSHDVKGGLGRRYVRVCEHLKHKVLQAAVEPDVFLVGVYASDITDYVVTKEGAECLVLASEHVKEEREELGGLKHVPMPEEDECTTKGHPHVAVQHSRVLPQKGHEGLRKRAELRRVALGHLRQEHYHLFQSSVVLAWAHLEYFERRGEVA